MEYELVRQLVLEALRRQLSSLKPRGDRGHLTVIDIVSQVARFAYERQLWSPPQPPQRPEHIGDMLPIEDAIIVKSILWQLIVQGVLIPGVYGDPQTNWPFFFVTEYGKTYLEAETGAPYDPDGYLACIKEESPNVDEVVLIYLTEGLQCFLRSNYIASVVMVGVAAEKVILNLIDAFASAMTDDSSASAFRRKTKNVMIKTQFDELTKQLYPLKRQLPNEWSKDLETYLGSIFNLIRNYRNEAGHPSGNEIPREIAYANLQLFRHFSKNVHGLILYFSNNKISI